MKKNILEHIVSFIFKYIWSFCLLLIAFEVISVTYTTGVLIEHTNQSVMQSASSEISGRVNGVLRLLNGMAKDERIADTSKPLFDRVRLLKPYQDSYGLYMIALTDEKVDVLSAHATEPPKEYKNLSYRDYMQRIYTTGNIEITDAFIAGADNTTLNYTVAVPIIKDGKTKGTVFGAIYFSDILDSNKRNSSRDVFLLGAKEDIMAASDSKYIGKSFPKLTQKAYFFDSSRETILHNIENGVSGEYWEWASRGLAYVSYQRVEPTNWTILYRVYFSSVLPTLLPLLCAKIVFYILLCALIYMFGKRYLTRRLAEVNHLLNRMATIQKEIFQSEQTDYTNLLELTERGLTDQLTGLATRAILFEKMVQLIGAPNAQGAVIFIDLDDLKTINDQFGHESGDYAIVYFAKILKRYESKYEGFAARYGGDEFILICDGIDRKHTVELVDSLCKDLQTDITTEQHSFAIHASMGVAFYPEDGVTPEDVICKADLALYSVKQKGKNRYAFYVADGNIV